MKITTFCRVLEDIAQDLEPEAWRLVVSLGAGVLDMAQVSTPEAEATLRDVCALYANQKPAAAMEAIRDWQARRLLAEALGPAFEFDQIE